MAVKQAFVNNAVEGHVCGGSGGGAEEGCRHGGSAQSLNEFHY